MASDPDEDTRTQAPPRADERTTLVAFLQRQPRRCR